MKRAYAAIGLCLLLALAGCSALPGASPATSEAPPGVEDDQLTNSTALLDAHVEAVTASGYSHEVNLTQNGTVDGESFTSERRQRTTVEADAAEYRYQLINNGRANSRFIVWGNETVEYQRIEAGGRDPQYRRGEPTASESLAGQPLLEPHLSAPYEVVDTTESNGTTLTTLSATDRPESEAAFPRNATNIREYESELVVDGDGRIRSLSVDVTYDLDGESADYQFEFELTDSEAPDVERPAWVESLEDSS
ncbi:hypothetical protein GJ631_08725 [Natronomonas sp. CBA1123]|jgi:hypothetical protein|uniref:DUF7537 family lipoprotein n=1 Tax=Natronomonas sp. CBA1123 TaxID=2668070 RepID=UPI0012E9D098|nr:hypothetical protein [Natronomonas sp. CBA1123]MUV86647.1 hypothetical protein [Natronomonas sp. CBA1123]